MAGGASIEAFCLEGSGGALNCLYYRPQGTRATFGDVLIVPAFGEEMHRCRSMVSAQARELARMGIGTLVIDLCGTGDSAGEFEDATWVTWREDLQRGTAWLRAHGQDCRTLLAVRSGALLAAELAAGDPHIDHLLLWQPVVDGKSFFTQFLRIRVAADMERANGVKGTDELRRELDAGKAVEVGGYRVSPDIAHSLDQLKLTDAVKRTDLRIAWYEILPAADASVGRGSLNAMEMWRNAGVDVQHASVIGPGFWQVHEREMAPQLLEATASRFGEWKSHTPPLTPVSGSDGVGRASLLVAPVEVPVVFDCAGEQLVGVIHKAGSAAKLGLVIVVAGGPQYRAGAHRQFVSMARKLAGQGIATLRFDLRGMGDSAGEYRGFEHSRDDIRAAIDALLSSEPHLQSVVLLGECESASGILFYAYRDPRVKGAVLINPWVRTDGGRAQVIMKHYYLQRILSKDFWRKVVAGRFKAFESGVSLLETLRTYAGARKQRRLTAGSADDLDGLPLPLKTAAGMQRFAAPVLLLMSGHDYIAREFDEVVKTSQAWKGLLDDPRLTRCDIAGADHTFSRDEWKMQAQSAICEWISRL